MQDAVEKLALNAAKLSYIKYVRKERSGEIIQNDVPDSFAITPYHIIFMKSTNITVLSKVGNEIVYNMNFDRSHLLRGIEIDHRKHSLMAFQSREKIMLTSLKLESSESWKHYLESGQYEMALGQSICIKQRAYVATIVANRLCN